jgi:predicted acyltransferase
MKELITGNLKQIAIALLAIAAFSVQFFRPEFSDYVVGILLILNMVGIAVPQPKLPITKQPSVDTKVAE